MGGDEKRMTTAKKTVNQCILCFKCPNNPSSNEPTIKLVPHGLEDVDGCDLCRAAIALFLAADLPYLYQCLLPHQESEEMGALHA